MVDPLGGHKIDCQTWKNMRFKHNMETKAWGVPTCLRTFDNNSTWKLPSEAQQAICDM